MRHHLARAQIILLGTFILFSTLYILFALESELAGQATTGTRVNITNSTPITCSVSVVPGRNTVSWPCISTTEPLSDVLNNSPAVDAMYQYVPGTSDVWRVHTETLPNWVVSDLSSLSRRVGYVLIANAAATFPVGGLNVSSTSVPFLAGWSLVGYPAFTTRSPATAFSSINLTLTEARTYDSGFLSYINVTQSGTLTEVTTGRGYWLNSTTSGTWVVDT
ncbi:MAG: hypothetical protein OXR66_07200 [Candidatus Woesearchaeota archaeon]|nr:hypothetical protein [Candidatus Woesearchaeota archaeon]